MNTADDGRSHLSPQTILLVEDDEDQLTIRAMLLAQLGFTVFQANHPEQAMELARLHNPRCALLDLRLPTVEDGLALIRTLKKENPAIRLMLLTGSRLPEDTPELPLLETVFHKPIASRELIEKLQSIANAP